jgi:hypothetical protein
MAEGFGIFGGLLETLYNLLNLVNTRVAHRFLLWWSRLTGAWDRLKFSITANVEDLPDDGQL